MKKIIETISTLYDIISTEKRNFLDRKDESYNPDYYPYIPINKNGIKELLELALEKYKKPSLIKFIDIGCGFPIIPLIFQKLGFNSYGLEYNKFYRKDIWLLGNNFIEDDLLKYDFQQFDLMYMYNPIQNAELMLEGLKNVLNTMKIGSVLFYTCTSSLCREYIEKELNLSKNYKFVKTKNTDSYVITSIK